MLSAVLPAGTETPGDRDQDHENRGPRSHGVRRRGEGTGGRCARTFRLACCLVAGLLLGVASGELTWADPPARIVDRTLVYFGKPNSFKKPASIEFSKVTAHIPEYKKIKEKGLKRGDAEYIVLAQEGTRRFRKVVKEVAEKKNLDLVAEKTAISAKKGTTLPDITKEVIKKLGGTP